MPASHVHRSAVERDVGLDEGPVATSLDHCPVTRAGLMHGSGGTGDAVVVTLRPAASRQAAVRVAMSAAAARALEGIDPDARLRQLSGGLDEAGDRAAQDPPSTALDADAWTRLLLLWSLATPMPHAQAARLPLRILPPPGLQAVNPVQALQVLLTLQMGRPGWSTRIARLEARVPGAAARQALRQLVHALWPRVHERGRPADAKALRWALEDAWQCPRVQRCWLRLAGLLTADESARIVGRAGTRSTSAWSRGTSIPQRKTARTRECETDRLRRASTAAPAAGRQPQSAPALRPARGPRTCLAGQQLALGV